jgi:opacity protein-like surface antigen
MKIIHDSAALLLLSTVWAAAGGNIAPTVSEITSPAPVQSQLALEGLYVGTGYSAMHMSHTDTLGDAEGNSISLLAGYTFNTYLAIEGRYLRTLGDLSVDIGTDRGDLSTVALYLKPQYRFADIFILYGLFGYGQVSLDNGTEEQQESGFQYGAGVSMMATDNIGIFVDYTRLYDDGTFDGLQNRDISVDSVNIGVYYKF